MSPDPRFVVDRLLPHRTPSTRQAEEFAPANIALCKYWGKREETLKLPLTGSLSISLAGLGTQMKVQIAEKDQLNINGQIQPENGKAFRRLFAFLELFREPGTFFNVQSRNTIPMAAGLASSASAFAGAVNTLNQLYGWNLSDSQRSILSRLGSGSASRSISHGFMEWHCGTQEDGMDSFAENLGVEWPEFRIGILTLSASEKPVGSSEGMQRTMESSILYRSWPQQVQRDLPRIREAVMQRDFETLGKTSEQNAMSMHATMISAWPPIIYWKAESVKTLHRVQSLRADGVQVYATMDAGPNVKILFTRDAEEDLKSVFPEMHVVEPFGHIPL